MKKLYFAILIVFTLITISCKPEPTINLSNCICSSIDYNYRITKFNISDPSKVKKLKEEFSNLKYLEDDGRVIFGVTLTLNCQNEVTIQIEINEDYIKLNNQKYQPQKTTERVIRQYKGDAYASKRIQIALESIDSTKSLSLRDCSIRDIPEEIFQLSNLEYLDLSVNLINKIPDEIGQLINLKELFISYNLIEQISPEISKLEMLESFWLLDNKLKSMPDGICQLNKLEELNLNGNAIKELPTCIPNMKSLKRLYIGSFEGVKQSNIMLKQIEEFENDNKRLRIRR